MSKLQLRYFVRYRSEGCLKFKEFFTQDHQKAVNISLNLEADISLPTF